MMLLRATTAACLRGVGLLVLGLGFVTLPHRVQAQLTVSVTGGVLLPVGDFTNQRALSDVLELGQHYSASLHIPLGVSQRWGLRLSGGWFANPLSEESESFRLTQVMTGIGPEFNFLPTGKLQPILSIQPGLFITGANLEETSNQGYLGVTGSFMLRYRFNNFVGAHIQGQYSRLFTRGSVSGGVRDLNYVPIGIGVSYTFDRRE